MRFLLDTHALVFWLLEPKKLGRKGKSLLADDTSTALISTMSLLEIQFLIEIKRIEVDFSEVMSFLGVQQGVEILSFSEKVCLQCSKLATRDPFDRVILASAIAEGIPIISRDRWMKRNYDAVVW